MILGILYPCVLVKMKCMVLTLLCLGSWYWSHHQSSFDVLALDRKRYHRRKVPRSEDADSASQRVWMPKTDNRVPFQCDGDDAVLHRYLDLN